jgi:hypothetical protein
MYLKWRNGAKISYPLGVGALDPKWKVARADFSELAKIVNFGFRPEIL